MFVFLSSCPVYCASAAGSEQSYRIGHCESGPCWEWVTSQRCVRHNGEKKESALSPSVGNLARLGAVGSF